MTIRTCHSDTGRGSGRCAAAPATSDLRAPAHQADTQKRERGRRGPRSAGGRRRRRPGGPAARPAATHRRAGRGARACRSLLVLRDRLQALVQRVAALGGGLRVQHRDRRVRLGQQVLGHLRARKSPGRAKKKNRCQRRGRRTRAHLRTDTVWVPARSRRRPRPGHQRSLLNVRQGSRRSLCAGPNSCQHP